MLPHDKAGSLLSGGYGSSSSCTHVIAAPQ
jgi:hypothetical protein